MPSHNEIPGDIKRSKFLKALKRLGFIINKTGGKGSHVLAIWPSTNKQITIQQDLRKDVLRSIIKSITIITNGQIIWDDIRKEL